MSAEQQHPPPQPESGSSWYTPHSHRGDRLSDGGRSSPPSSPRYAAYNQQHSERYSGRYPQPREGEENYGAPRDDYANYYGQHWQGYYHHGYGYQHYPPHHHQQGYYPPYYPADSREAHYPRSFPPLSDKPSSRSPSPPGIPAPPSSDTVPSEKLPDLPKHEGSALQGPLKESRLQNDNQHAIMKKDEASLLLDFKKTAEEQGPWPVPESYPTRLALPNDHVKLNKLHCFVREELLEVFVLNDDSQSRGRVGLRCVHCAMKRRDEGAIPSDEVSMAFFYPKKVDEIYRLVTSWQRCHLKKCKSLPPSVRAQWEAFRSSDDKSRGKTKYWQESACEIGLVDIRRKAGGVRFAEQQS